MPNEPSLQSITEIDLDLGSEQYITKVSAKQYDTARKIKAHLFDNGVQWEVPDIGSRLVSMVSYKKSDRIGGFYDITELGETAITVGEDRSVMYFILDRQLLTTVGFVYVDITFYEMISSETATRLSTFRFAVDVQSATVTELDLSSNPRFDVLATNIAKVLNAESNLAGLTATARKTNPGTLPNPTVTGGTGPDDPYNIDFGIPTFAGIEVTASGLAAGATPTATIASGTGTSTKKYKIQFGIPKGDKGDMPVPTTAHYQYATSDSGTTIPVTGWSDTVDPVHSKSKFIWTKTTQDWDSGDSTVTYIVTYVGVDGTGAVHSVNDKTGNVSLNASEIKRTDGTTTIETALTSKPEVIRLTNVSVPRNNFSEMTSSDADYASIHPYFPYKGVLDSSVNSAFAGVTSNMYAQVTFGVKDVMDGNFGPITKCDNGRIYVYAMSQPTAATVIPSIVVIKMEGD